MKFLSEYTNEAGLAKETKTPWQQEIGIHSTVRLKLLLLHKTPTGAGVFCRELGLELHFTG